MRLILDLLDQLELLEESGKIVENHTEAYLGVEEENKSKSPTEDDIKQGIKETKNSLMRQYCSRRNKHCTYPLY